MGVIIRFKKDETPKRLTLSLNSKNSNDNLNF